MSHIENATHAIPPMLTIHIQPRASPERAIATTARIGRAIRAYQSHTPAARRPAETEWGVKPHDRYMA